MKEIVLLSGKGGTGKTNLCGCFAQLSGGAVLADCDVDASNLPLLLRPEIRSRHDFYAGFEPQFDPLKCLRCGDCSAACPFQALGVDASGLPRLRATGCEGCAVCVSVCKTDAVTMISRQCGEWYESQTSCGVMFHAKLLPGGENSGKLIAQLRRAAKQKALAVHAANLICDGPPGIGCPAISAVSGADLAILVTEPTVSGLHDLKRVAQLVKQFGVPAQVVINKCDLNPEMADAIQSFCQSKQIALAGRVKFDPLFQQTVQTGDTVLKYPQSEPAQAITQIWQTICATLN